MNWIVSVAGVGVLAYGSVTTDGWIQVALVVALAWIALAWEVFARWVSRENAIANTSMVGQLKDATAVLNVGRSEYGKVVRDYAVTNDYGEKLTAIGAAAISQLSLHDPQKADELAGDMRDAYAVYTEQIR